MKLSRIIHNINSHPLNQDRKIAAICTFLWWQLRSRIIRKPYNYRFTRHAVLRLRKGDPAATANLYYGLHEFNEMGFLLHFLRAEDIFVDVGANIGSYTILASKHVGAASIAFEPGVAAYEELQHNIAVNGINTHVISYAIALADAKGSLGFTQDKQTMNHVATGAGTIVPSDTLDNILCGKRCPTLIKIDVEGYELPVLKGAANTLKDEHLKALIIEVNYLAKRFGARKEDIWAMLEENSFRPFQYDPMKRQLLPLPTFARRNTIFLRDIDFVVDRIRSAPMVELRGKRF